MLKKKREREVTNSNNKNEGVDITTKFIDIKSVIKKYEKLYAKNGKMDKFLRSNK